MGQGGKKGGRRKEGKRKEKEKREKREKDGHYTLPLEETFFLYPIDHGYLPQFIIMFYLCRHLWPLSSV